LLEILAIQVIAHFHPRLIYSCFLLLDFLLTCVLYPEASYNQQGKTLPDTVSLWLKARLISLQPKSLSRA
jgi:hypothetical protein